MHCLHDNAIFRNQIKAKTTKAYRLMWRSSSSNRFAPPHDVIELTDRVIVMIEVAGITADDVKINLTDQRLVISGVRNRPTFANAANHRVEIGYGEFRLDIPLTWDIQQNDVSASYRDGFLQINLPRRPQQQIPVANIEDKQNRSTHDE